jgi:iron complex transport system substrate-binding protein
LPSPRKAGRGCPPQRTGEGGAGSWISGPLIHRPDGRSPFPSRPRGEGVFLSPAIRLRSSARFAWMFYLRVLRLAAFFSVFSLMVGSLFAREVIDGLGRKVQVPDHPKRIISLAPSLTESLYALGLGDQVVGVTDYCQNPPEVLGKPRIGGIINPNLETIVSLKPDLVFATSEANKYEFMARLEQFAIPVFSIVPRDIAGVLESLRLMGEAANVAPRAEKLIQDLKLRYAAVRNKVQNLRPVRVLIAYDLQPVITGGRWTFPTDLVAAAGGCSIAAGLEQDWPRLNMEYILAQDPEVIFLAAMPEADRQLRVLSNLPGWKNTTAVKLKRVIAVDDRINQPGPRLMEALEMIAGYLHPEGFKR